MVYAMLSSGISWERIESGIDIETGWILPIDEIFNQYHTDSLCESSSEQLYSEIKRLHYAGISTAQQMKALLNVNIPKLIDFEKNFGSVDSCYQKHINSDPTLKTLVRFLSDPKSKNKMHQMDVALISEYLRNVGYDIPKPDRHIKRILGCKHLACSEKEIVPAYDVFDIISELSARLSKCAAEVDFILWSYCAKGYGEVCTSKNPKCDKCVAKNYCKKL